MPSALHMAADNAALEAAVKRSRKLLNKRALVAAAASVFSLGSSAGSKAARRVRASASALAICRPPRPMTTASSTS